jgi:hypothetical protein
MRTCFFLFILTVIFFACTQESGTKLISNKPEKKIRKQALKAVENYAVEHLKDAKKSVDKDGIITLTGNGITYSLDPSKIFTGEIDEDSDADAIAFVLVQSVPMMEMPEHLILINNEGNLIVAKVIESDMKILGIKDRIITAEVPTHSRNSPLYDCASCREIVNYRFRMGELVRMK